MSVDFPAPFSPVIAWTDPERPEKDTADNASVGPKRLVTSRNSITGPPTLIAPEVCSVIAMSDLSNAFVERFQNGWRWLALESFLNHVCWQRRGKPIGVV